MSTNIESAQAQAQTAPGDPVARENPIHLHAMWAAIGASLAEHAEDSDSRRAHKSESLLHADGIDIYYQRAGTGKPLLFINGSGATLANSSDVISLYSAHFDVVAHDQRGLGRTTIADSPYTMAHYATDAAAVAQAVGWDRYRVVGTSFGGMVAQQLALMFPERIERLALICTSPGGAGGTSYPLHTRTDHSGTDQAQIGPQILDTRFTPQWLESHPNDRALLAMMTGHTEVEKSAEVLRGERLQLQARAHHDVYDRLARITCPTLVASGHYDGLAPPSNALAIAERIPNAELHIYEGGHAFFVQDQQALPDIIEFLNR